jgi:proteasome lid subunit RPN8/RPN11
MNKTILIPRIKIAGDVWQQIRSTVGTLSPERGGILGGNPATGHVARFFFDARAESSNTTYSLDADRINPVIQAWNDNDIHLLGVLHSHPGGLEEPSTQDIEFAFRLLMRSDNAALQYFLIPIVQTSADGQFSMRLFAVTRATKTSALELQYAIDETNPQPAFPVPSRTYRETFARVSDSYDLARMYNSLVVMVGCGGAASYCEDVTRAGVRHIVVIDRDTVAPSNIATSQFYWSEVGMPKVKAIEKRILDINPQASVQAIERSLDEISDEEFRSIVFPGESPCDDIEARLLCALTDDFWCQARIARIGLNLGLPALSAQVYKGGSAAEIVFTHPETTRQCMRCILSRRYAAYLENGFQNDGTTQGAQYIATPRLNATKLPITMALLHHGSSHPFWGPMLARIGQRNCLQIRCNPDVAQTIGLTNFDEAFAGADPEQTFFDETIWRPQHPESLANGYDYDCPDCGGGGDLRAAIGKFADTRLIRPLTT